MLRIVLGILIAVYGLTVGVVLRAAEVRSTCPTLTDKNYFFPHGLLDSTRADIDDYVRVWYSKSLRVMGEPSLSCGDNPRVETYRFLWLRTFHHPISIRITRSESGIALVAIELTGAGGGEPGSIGRRVHKSLTVAQWESLQGVLNHVAFWKVPTRPPEPGLGLDGAQWIIEGRRAAQYHVVDRWTPKKGSYRDAGLHFLQLSGLSVPEKELY